MWNIVRGTALGTSHRITGSPCQDYAEARVVTTPSGPVLIAACADGAGSAAMAEIGARLAVDTFVALADDALVKENLDPSLVNQSVLQEWIAAARDRVEREAHDQGVAARQLACTLLTAIVGPESAAFSQIGDGVIVLDGPGGYEVVFWPDSGEFANTTQFLTDGDYLDHFHSDNHQRAIHEIAILTDGLQRLALNYAESRVHNPFFKPMFEALRGAPDGEFMRPALETFLDSDRVNQRTDDDKTLLLAVRKITPDHVPGVISPRPFDTDGWPISI